MLATHLHFDHVGGFTDARRDGAAGAALSAARATSSARAEWEDATHPHERNRASYLQENFVPLKDAGVAATSSTTTRRSCRASASCAPAATRCITRSSIIESGGRTAVFAADLIPTTAHIDEPWIMGYDLYPMDTLAFKRRFIREAIDREYLIFFEHDPRRRGRLHPREATAGRYVEPVL